MGKAKQNAICKYKDICSQQIILKNIRKIYLYIIYGQVGGGNATIIGHSIKPSKYVVCLNFFE